jgi:hypothetical protein
MATCSFETSIDFHLITRRYIPRDITLHNHRCENLKYNIVRIVLGKIRICDFNSVRCRDGTAMWTVGDRFLQRQEIFSLLHSAKTVSGAHSVFYPRVSEALSSG